MRKFASLERPIPVVYGGVDRSAYDTVACKRSGFYSTWVGFQTFTRAGCLDLEHWRRVHGNVDRVRQHACSDRSIMYLLAGQRIPMLAKENDEGWHDYYVRTHWCSQYEVFHSPGAHYRFVLESNYLPGVLYSVVQNQP